MKTIFQKIRSWLPSSGTKKQAATDAKPSIEPKDGRPLVASRPPSLNIDAHFQVVRRPEVVAEAFDDLRRYVFRMTDEPPDPDQILAKPLFREYGELPGKRHYFYLQRAGERGLLFEETATGWVISSAEKIAAQDLFLRMETPIDIVTLYQSLGHDQGRVRPRMSSPKFGQGYFPSAVYHKKLMDLLQVVRDKQRPPTA